MIRAITPPKQKKRNDVIKYRYPMVLWSVEVIQLTTMRPLETGAKREAVELDVSAAAYG